MSLHEFTATWHYSPVWCQVCASIIVPLSSHVVCHCGLVAHQECTKGLPSTCPGSITAAGAKVTTKSSTAANRADERGGRNNKQPITTPNADARAASAKIDDVVLFDNKLSRYFVNGMLREDCWLCRRRLAIVRATFPDQQATVLCCLRCIELVRKQYAALEANTTTTTTATAARNQQSATKTTTMTASTSASTAAGAPSALLATSTLTPLTKKERRKASGGSANTMTASSTTTTVGAPSEERALRQQQRDLTASSTPPAKPPRSAKASAAAIAAASTTDANISTLRRPVTSAPTPTIHTQQQQQQQQQLLLQQQKQPIIQAGDEPDVSAEALQFCEAGNKLFESDVAAAVRYYQRAANAQAAEIAARGAAAPSARARRTLAVCHANVSAARLVLNDASAALSAAEHAIDADASWPRAVYRQAKALLALRRADEALQRVSEARQRHTESEELKLLQAECQRAVDAANAKVAPPVVYRDESDGGDVDDDESDDVETDDEEESEEEDDDDESSEEESSE